MRNYGRFTTTIYRDDDFRALTIAQQGVYYLLGLQPEMAATGTLSLTLRRWSNMAADLTVEELRDHLKALEAHGHVVIDEDTEELLIVKFVKFDGGIGNEKRRPVIEEAASTIASTAIRQTLGHEIANLGYADMASKVAPDTAFRPPGNALSDGQSGFDRVVVKQGDQIPQPLHRNPEGEPQSACPIPEPAATGASAEPPSMTCSKHPAGTEEACGPCGTARKRYAAWAETKLEREVAARKAAAEARAACEFCDDRGMRLDERTRQPIARCDHRSTS
jgi:hypothetical protein